MEEEMEETKSLNHSYATIGWGALLIWWGISFIVGPITIGLSAIGTGLILLGINAARMFKGIPSNRSTTGWGITFLAWGVLDHFLKLNFGQSCAALLIVIGLVTLGSLLTRSRVENNSVS
jgi:hypothetical protein